MKRAETLAEVRQVTEVTPLEGEALRQFYVPADAARDPLFPPSHALRDYLYETPPPFRLLFASHGGAGKTTELNRLMLEAGDDFWFVRLTVQTALDIATLTHIDLILALMETVYIAGRQEKLIHDRRVIEPVRNWLREVVRETKVAREEELDAEAGIGVDGLLAQIIGLQAKLRSAFSLSHESAQTVRQVLQPRIAELRQYCNQVLVEVASHLDKRALQRRLVLIVEGTDKLDVPIARDLFVNHTGLLADLQASIIYTVPLFLIHSADRKRLESYFETLTLPMVKTHIPTGERFTTGWEVLREIVARRLNVETLIAPAALVLAIEKTGGVLRDLLWAIQRAAQVARYEKTDRISVEAMRHSLDQLKTHYSQSVYSNIEGVSTADLYAKMKAIAEAPLGKAPVDDALQLLLYMQAVIEYNNRGWYDLHPLIARHCKKWGISMTWPGDQERQWELLLAELQDSERGLFTVLYDRPFTREALLRRLQTEFDRRGWRLIKTALAEERLTPHLAVALRDLPAKAAVVRMEGVYLPRFRALNLEREALHALPTNILFVLSQEAHSGFLASAHDLVTWIAPPYTFALPETGVPDLPAPAAGTRQELTDRVQYLREQVQAALEDDRIEAAFSLLPTLADLYLAADMYDAAHQVYRALTLHYEQAADGRQAALFAQRRDVAQGWRILADLDAGRSLVSKDRAAVKRLLDDKLLVIRGDGNGLVAADEMGHEKPLSTQTLAILQALSERAATTLARPDIAWDSVFNFGAIKKQVPEPARSETGQSRK